MAVTVFTVFEVTSVDSFATALPMASISRPSSPIDASDVTTPTGWLLLPPPKPPKPPGPPAPPGPPGRPPGPPFCAPAGALPPGPAPDALPLLFEQPASTTSRHRAKNMAHAEARFA